MFGSYNMVLRVNAAQKSYDLNMISDDILSRTLGGKGLATHLLLKHNPAGVDPMSPDNHLIFAIGPATGTAVWGCCRYGVYTKSPQTGYYSESYSGGHSAEYMAKTGFDAVLIHGTSDEPVWLEVSHEGARFHSAADLWGLETYETEDRVKAWLKENRGPGKNCGVVVIGPAGENGVTFSVIGRTTGGATRDEPACRAAVMGSKKIKAIAFWGNKTKELANPDLVRRFSKDLAQRAKEDAGVKAYKSMGTPMMVDIMSKVGRRPSPTRYWHKGRADHQAQINAAALHERCEVSPHACLKCFIACGRMSTVKEGRHKGLKIEGPKYETIYAFGGLCEIQSIEEVAYLNDLCDRLGVDTISAGNLAALTIEASRQGKIDYQIDYGQVDRIATLLKEIAMRQGLGDTLAKGIKVAAEAMGMADQAIHVKGLEPAGTILAC